MSKRLRWALLASVVQHLLIFMLYAATLDGGRLARICAAVALAFWLIVLVIVVRRGGNPTKIDIGFIAAGYPLMVFLCVIVVDGRL